MTNDSPNDCREAFEKWAEEKGKWMLANQHRALETDFNRQAEIFAWQTTRNTRATSPVDVSLLHRLRAIHALMFDGDNEGAFERLTTILREMTDAENGQHYGSAVKSAAERHNGAASAATGLNPAQEGDALIPESAPASFVEMFIRRIKPLRDASNIRIEWIAYDTCMNIIREHGRRQI